MRLLISSLLVLSLFTIGITQFESEIQMISQFIHEQSSNLHSYQVFSETIRNAMSVPIIILAGSIAIWWILGKGNKNSNCVYCAAPLIFGRKCLSCGMISKDRQS
ncbi:hypothetical protein K0U27_00770 [archaeon]|nr:hypothetical protein [archaeon]